MRLPIRATHLDIPFSLRPGYAPATATATAARNAPPSGPRYGPLPAPGEMPRRHKYDSELPGAASTRPREQLATLLDRAQINSSNMRPMPPHALPQYAHTPLRPQLPLPVSGYGMAATPPSWGSHKPNGTPAAPPPIAAHARPQPYPQASQQPSQAPQFLRPSYPSTSLQGMPASPPTRTPLRPHVPPKFGRVSDDGLTTSRLGDLTSRTAHPRRHPRCSRTLGRSCTLKRRNSRLNFCGPAIRRHRLTVCRRRTRLIVSRDRPGWRKWRRRRTGPISAALHRFPPRPRRRVPLLPQRTENWTANLSSLMIKRGSTCL
ncbi:MAG: hypothetical protein QOI13_1039 [Paraburkholderia sp.]|nr:hypothetical protein [Paraburkholderia sp.]